MVNNKRTDIAEQRASSDGKQQFSQAQHRRQAAPLEDMIKKLARGGHLRSELISEDGGEQLTAQEIEQRRVQNGLALVQISIREAQRWGEYYERRRRGLPAKAAHRRVLATATEKAADRLDEFACGHASELRSNTEPRVAATHPLSRASIAETLEGIETLRMRLKRLADALDEPLSGVKGRPSNDWLLGFIWAMAVGWRDLTAAKISPVGRFPQFLQLTWQSISAAEAPEPEWATLIKTAVARFHIHGKDWLRPGDDLRTEGGGEKSGSI